MMRIAALDQQKSLRDLAGLSRLCDEVAWCDVESLTRTADAALIVGLWLFDHPGPARTLLDARSEASLTTILVPRFKAGDLNVVLNSPTSVRIKAGEYDAFQWDDETDVNVGGLTLIESSLHKGQWGSVAGMGEAVLAYRAHEAAGWIVLCTAAITSKKFGVDMEAQRWLLDAIITRAAASAPMSSTASESAMVQPARGISEFLEKDEHAPAVVLAAVLNRGDREVATIGATLSHIGFELSEEDLRWTLARMPDVSADEMERALRQSGWGAYLRRGRSLLADGGVE